MAKAERVQISPGLKKLLDFDFEDGV